MNEINDTLPLWEDNTLDSINLFIESQCTIEEVYAAVDLTKKEIEKKFNIKDFSKYYKTKQSSGVAKVKARCYSKAMEGDSIMLRHLTQNIKPVQDNTFTVVTMPDNGRVKE